MKNYICIIIVCLIAPITSYSEQFNVFLENDCFLTHADNDYTHGTCLEYVNDNFWHFRAGQNMYAPSDLRREDHIEGDRPYCGYIYGGAGYELFRKPNSPWTHYAELDVGLIGPHAFCKQTQKFIHKILGCKDPKGWDNQLHDEMTANAQWWTKYNWYVYKRHITLVPRGGVLVGTVEDAIEVGCDLKIGWNLQNDVGNAILFSGVQNKSWKDKLMCYAFCGIDGRYYLYNHILEGSMFSHKDDGLGVNICTFVPEFRFGLKLEYDSYFAQWYGVMRTNEFKTQEHSPDYGGISFGFDF